MKFELDRASMPNIDSIRKTIEGAYIEEASERHAISTKKFEEGQQQGLYRNVTDVKLNTEIERTEFTVRSECLFINIETLGTLFKFIKEHGELIIGESDLIGVDYRITVYDDTVEGG